MTKRKDVLNFIEKLNDFVAQRKRNNNKAYISLKTVDFIEKGFSFDEDGKIVVVNGEDLFNLIGFVYYFNFLEKHPNILKDYDEFLIEKKLDEKFIIKKHYASITCDLNFINISNVEDLSYLFSFHTKALLPIFTDSKSHKLIEFSFNHIKPIFNEWCFENITSLEGFFLGSDYNAKALTINAPKLISIKKMFINSSFKGDVVIKSDCLTNIVDVVDFHSKLKSLSIPLNNVVSFEMTFITQENKQSEDAKALHALLFHKEQQGIQQFVENLHCFQPLLKIINGTLMLTFVTINDNLDWMINNLSITYHSFFFRKNNFNINCTNKILSEEDVFHFNYETEKTFSIIELLKGNYHLLFKKQFFIRCFNLFKDGLIFLKGESNIEFNEVEKFAKKIDRYDLSSLDDIESVRLKYLDKMLNDIKEDLIELNIDLNTNNYIDDNLPINI